MPPPALTLHHHALHPHTVHLETLVLTLSALTLPPPPTYHGPHTLNLTAFAHAIFLTLSTTASTFAALSSAAYESCMDILHPPYPACAPIRTQRASRSVHRLGRLIHEFHALLHRSRLVSAALSHVQEKHSQARVHFARRVLDSEQCCMRRRKTWCHAEHRVREMETLIRHARRQEREASAGVWFARCRRVVMMPIRVFGGGGGAGGSDGVVEAALRRRMRKSRIVDRVASDRVGVIQQRAVEARGLLEGAVEVKKLDALLQAAHACMERAVEDYAAVRAIERALSGIVTAVEAVADMCAGIAADAVNGGDLETWHTVKVASQLFAWEQTETCRKLSAAMEHL